MALRDIFEKAKSKAEQVLTAVFKRGLEVEGDNSLAARTSRGLLRGAFALVNTGEFLSNRFTAAGRAQAKQRQEISALLESHDEALRSMIEKALLSNLGSNTRRQTDVILQGIIKDPLLFFETVDAMTGVIKRSVSSKAAPEERAAPLTMNTDGTVSLGDKILVSRDLLEAEIRMNLGGIQFPQSFYKKKNWPAAFESWQQDMPRVLADWVVQALRDVPQLLPDYDSAAGVDGKLVLTRVSRPNVLNETTEDYCQYMTKRWKNGSAGPAANPPTPAI